MFSFADNDGEAIDPLTTGAPDTADIVAVGRNESVPEVNMLVFAGHK